MITLSPKARALILSSESLNQPSKWPGGNSGITLGYGYDLGQVSKEEFLRDWAPYLHPAALQTLSACVGLKGERAKRRAQALTHIKIDSSQSAQVFDAVMVPKFCSLTERTFPGISLLPPDAQGALVSLVFNRGGALEGERTVEMRTIRALIQQANFALNLPTLDDDAGSNLNSLLAVCLPAIANQIRLMKRLWAGKGLDGLLIRREEEAKLVESCIPVP